MKKKFPRYLLIALGLYAFAFLIMLLDFVIPMIQIGIAPAEFYFYLLLMVLPMMLLLAYLKTEFAERHGLAFRLAIMISSVALSMVFMFIIAPLLF